MFAALDVATGRVVGKIKHRHRGIVALEKAVRAYVEIHNEQPKPFRWTKSADEIFASVNSVDKVIDRAEH